MRANDRAFRILAAVSGDRAIRTLLLNRIKDRRGEADAAFVSQALLLERQCQKLFEGRSRLPRMTGSAERDFQAHFGVRPRRKTTKARAL